MGRIRISLPVKCCHNVSIYHRFWDILIVTVRNPSPLTTSHPQSILGRATLPHLMAENWVARVCSPGDTDKRWITCVANRLLYWKTNVIGAQDTWVKCGSGPQIWSTFYLLMVRTSAGPHFTNGPVDTPLCCNFFVSGLSPTSDNIFKKLTFYIYG